MNKRAILILLRRFWHNQVPWLVLLVVLYAAMFGYAAYIDPVVSWLFDTSELYRAVMFCLLMVGGGILLTFLAQEAVGDVRRAWHSACNSVDCPQCGRVVSFRQGETETMCRYCWTTVTRETEATA